MGKSMEFMFHPHAKCDDINVYNTIKFETFFGAISKLCLN